MRKQIPADKTNEVVEFSKLSPQQRLANIRHGLGVRNFPQAKMNLVNVNGTTQVLAHGQSEYVREFGMAVNPDPIVVKARVIAPPVLRYGPGSRELTIVSLMHNLIIEF
jgi:eukaryotic translation initiation factor 2C